MRMANPTKSFLTPEQRSDILLSNICDKDCAVIAIQAITGYKRRAAEQLARRFGYSDTGMHRGNIEKALSDRGYTLCPMTLNFGTTPAVFATTHEYGKFLVYTAQHVMALVDGDLYNSRGMWHDRVEQITEIR
jgi:hypothetical protein